jgi:hypothetical protein
MELQDTKIEAAKKDFRSYKIAKGGSKLLAQLRQYNIAFCFWMLASDDSYTNPNPHTSGRGNICRKYRR